MSLAGFDACSAGQALRVLQNLQQLYLEPQGEVGIYLGDKILEDISQLPTLRSLSIWGSDGNGRFVLLAGCLSALVSTSLRQLDLRIGAHRGLSTERVEVQLKGVPNMPVGIDPSPLHTHTLSLV